MATKRRKNKTKRISSPGNEVASPGAISEDYLSRFNSEPTNYNEYNKMRRGDYQVKRMLNVIKSPIKSGKFQYRYEEGDEEQRKQALYKNNFYHKHATKRWQTTLGEILTYLDFGFCYFEPTAHSVEDPELGKIITLRDLGFIKQSTCKKWNRANGELKSITQTFKDQGKSDTVDIPKEDLLMFVNEQEGDNVRGTSILRSAYGNWVRKELYLKLDMIGLERMSIGTPLAFAPKSLLQNANDKQYLFDVVRKYLANEQAGIILDERLKDNFEIVKGEYKSDSVNTSIVREDMGMLDTILASFLAIGTAKSGGNSQNEGQMSLFLNSLLFMAEYIAAILDDLSHYYYVLNFGDPKVRLDMDVSGIAKNDERDIMEVLRGYASADIIRGDNKLEAHVRDRLGLPVKDEATERDATAQSSTEYREGQDDPDETKKKQDKPAEPDTSED